MHELYMCVGVWVFIYKYVKEEGEWNVMEKGIIDVSCSQSQWPSICNSIDTLPFS